MAGLLAEFSAASFRAAGSRDPSDDRWYRGSTLGVGSSGVFVTPEVAMTLSALWQGVRLLAEGVATMPCQMFRRRGEDGRERVRGSTGYGALAFNLEWLPHPEFTAFDFWSGATACWVLRGLFLAELQGGLRTGFADALVPIHPDLVTVTRRPNGRIYYDIGGLRPRTLSSDQVLAIRGRTEADGLTPMSLIRYGAQSIGTTLSADRFAGRFFKDGASPALAVTVQDELGPEGVQNLYASVAKYVSGLNNAFGILPLENGAKVETIGINPSDAQLLASRQFGVEEIARWLNVPLHMLRYSQQGTGAYASLEIFSAEFVTYTLQPIVTAFEQAIKRDLILEDDRDELFVKFNMDSKLRGSLRERYEAYRIGIMSGFLRRNEARIKEDLDPADGLDEFWTPMNMAQVDNSAGQPGSDRAAKLFGFSHGLRSGREGFLLVRLVQEAAARCVRREKAEVERLARQHATDGGAWAAGLRKFYAEHAQYLASTLHLEPVLAESWASKRSRTLLDQGVAAVEAMDYASVAELAVMALGSDEPRPADDERRLAA
jgi:HK97 family phage portal protein